MAAKPALPEGYTLPETVNGWRHDPADGSNGHTWHFEAGERPLAVRGFEHFGRSYATIGDERTTGSESSEKIAVRNHEGDANQAKRTTVAAVVTTAVEWMRAHGSGDWSHPRIHEPAFDPPDGYELTIYEIAQRWTSIHYHRIDSQQRHRLAGVGRPDEVTPETYPYLVIRTWTGSGNSEIELAPWRFSHENERESIADPPAECGLSAAVEMAHGFAREIDTSGPDDSPLPRQKAVVSRTRR